MLARKKTVRVPFRVPAVFCAAFLAYFLSGIFSTVSAEDSSRLIDELFSKRNPFTATLLTKGIHSAMSMHGRVLAKTASAKTRNGHFYRHVMDAIEINKERSDIYSLLSSGKSEKISRQLIKLEYGMLPLARTIDAMAEKFQKQGIPIIENDFVSMADIMRPQRATFLRGRMTPQIEEQYFQLIRQFRKDVFRLGRQKLFAAIETTGYTCLRKLLTLEEETNCSVAMGKHLVESIILAAEHALEYRSMSQGKTDRLAAANILLQAVGLYPLCRLDIQAAPLHEQGLGILINDLPVIVYCP